MAWHELPLIIFTVFAQTSVGAFLILGLGVLSGQLNEEQHKRLHYGMFFIWCLMGLGFVASTLHLGSPFRMFNSLNRVGASWLSNEIFTCSLFFGLGGIYWLAASFSKISEAIQKTLLSLAMIASLVAMFAMTKVYLIDTVPTWNTFYTPINFGLTVILSGFVFANLLLAYSIDANWPIMRSLPRIGLVIAIISLLFALMQQMDLSHIQSAIVQANELIPNMKMLLIIRYVLLFLGVIFWQLSLRKENSLPVLFCAFIIILVSELMGRGLFYGLHMTVGL